MSRCWFWRRSLSFWGDCMRSFLGEVAVPVVGGLIVEAVNVDEPAFCGDRGVDGGTLIVFPEVGRSDRPELEETGFRRGMLDMESLRFFAGFVGKALIVISSLASDLPVSALGLRLPARDRKSVV